MLTIYTDGSCTGKDGGWGVIALIGNVEIEICGFEKNTTNNKMELTAVIEGIKQLSNFNSFHIHSDSLYVINCATGKFKRNANLDLWKKYDEITTNKNIQYTWVKGHSGNIYNERVDKLAKNYK